MGRRRLDGSTTSHGPKSFQPMLGSTARQGGSVEWVQISARDGVPHRHPRHHDQRRCAGCSQAAGTGRGRSTTTSSNYFITRPFMCCVTRKKKICLSPDCQSRSMVRFCNKCAQTGHSMRMCFTFKTQKCKYFERGVCSRQSDACSYAHGDSEVRPSCDTWCTRIVYENGQRSIEGCGNPGHLFGQCSNGNWVPQKRDDDKIE